MKEKKFVVKGKDHNTQLVITFKEKKIIEEQKKLKEDKKETEKKEKVETKDETAIPTLLFLMMISAIGMFLVERKRRANEV